MDIKIKGVSVKNLFLLTKENFNEKYDEWFNSLDIIVRTEFKELISISKFYDIQTFYVEPLQALGRVCYEGDVNKAAFDIGYLGGKKELTGIYSILLKIPSLEFILGKLGSFVKTYYEGISAELVETTGKHIIIEFYGFEHNHTIMFSNISGFITYLLETITKKKCSVSHQVVNKDSKKVIGKILIKIE